MKYEIMIGAMVGVLASPCLANEIYTYQSNGPLNEINTDISNPGYGTPIGPDNYLTISFTVANSLLPNTTYNISVSPSSGKVSSWAASDMLHGFHITGGNDSISMVPYSGGLGGVTLSECGAWTSCFGGAIYTDEFSNVAQWNLVASDPIDGASFITYNSPYLTTATDAISAPNIFELGPNGSWSKSGSIVDPVPVPVPEPSSITLLGMSLIGLLFQIWRFRRS